MNRALAYLETLYPGQIGEVCHIDISGRELARVVHGEVAGHDDLSENEAENPFFAPTFALDFGQVYQARPYRSPDTADWVISNSTLVPTADGRKHSIVHYEISLTGLGDSMAGLDRRSRIVDAKGVVLIDSDLTQDRASHAPLGFAEQTQFRGQFAAASTTQVKYANVGGERVAYLRMSPNIGNDNDWYLVSSAPLAIGWTTGFGPASIAMLALGVAMLLISWRTWTSYQRTLHRMSLTDNLTGLANRVLLHDRFDQAIKAARRNQTQAAILLLDLDQFKEINDTLGHHRGDQLLQRVSERLTTVLREGDTLARLGGDEFAIMLRSTDGSSGAIAAAERVEQALHSNFSIADLPVHVGTSIGIAVYPEHGETIDVLLQHADVAMYRAKHGGLRHAVYEPNHDEYSTDQLSLVAELRDAILNDGLELHYQPIFNLARDQSIGVEALVRWWHPVRGMVMPNDFIPAAERTGLIRPLTAWVLGTGLRQLRRWHDEGLDLTLAVNLSPKSLTDPELLFDISGALLDADIDARYLVLEVTENSFISDPARSIKALEEIRTTRRDCLDRRLRHRLLVAGLPAQPADR